MIFEKFTRLTGVKEVFNWRIVNKNVEENDLNLRNKYIMVRLVK